MKISIIGAAGYVGANTAFALALYNLADEIVLVDPFKPNMVQHFAMDAGTAVADLGVKLATGDYAGMKDSNIVIVTAGAAQGLIASRMEMLPRNLPIIRDLAHKIKDNAPDAIVITATNPVDPLNYAMYKFTGFDRQRVIGYTTNDSIRFRMMVGETLGYDTADVEGYVIGEHGEHQVLMFSTVKIRGKAVKIEEATRQKILAQSVQILRTYEELQTGRTAGLTSGVGMKNVVEAIVNNTHAVFPLSVVMDGEYGAHNLGMGTPVRLGAGGIQSIIELKPAADERPGVNEALKAMSAAARIVDEFIAKGK